MLRARIQVSPVLIVELLDDRFTPSLRADAGIVGLSLRLRRMLTFLSLPVHRYSAAAAAAPFTAAARNGMVQIERELHHARSHQGPCNVCG